MRIVTIVHHRVADYDAWKAVYDSVADLQREGGVREHAVLRSADDPALVVVVHTFDGPDAANAFLARADLEDVLARAGVDLASLQIEILEEAVAGRL